MGRWGQLCRLKVWWAGMHQRRMLWVLCSNNGLPARQQQAAPLHHLRSLPACDLRLGCSLRRSRRRPRRRGLRS